jgi:hypothetical protein
VIVSYQHHYVFLKTRKVAGSSVELFLRRHCGPDDIVTALSPEDEAIAVEVGARASTGVATRYARPWELTPRRARKVLRDRRWPVVREWWGHQPAESVRRQLGEEIWQRSFKFSIVRNPWDRVVSSYYWRRSRRGDQVTLDEVIADAGRNWEILAIDGRVAVDRVVRFEHLLDGLHEVCDQVGIPRPDELPRLKAGLRPPGADYRELLTVAQADRIALICRHEIETFGYTFDG